MLIVTGASYHMVWKKDKSSMSEPMETSCASSVGYISHEYIGLVCILLGSLVNG